MNIPILLISIIISGKSNGKCRICLVRRFFLVFLCLMGFFLICYCSILVVGGDFAPFVRGIVADYSCKFIL